MRTILPVMLFATLFAAQSELVMARGGSGGGPGGGSGAPHFGGPSSHSQAAANSNGRFATDRDTGLERAEDRMSAQGKAHKKATTAHKKRRHSGNGDNAATPATPATKAAAATSTSAATPAAPATPASPTAK